MASEMVLSASPKILLRLIHKGKPGGPGASIQEQVLEEFLCDQKYSDEENLPEKLAAFKEKYVEFDLNNEGEIDLMSLKRMMEKLGVPKTHLEMKKMISEVTGGVSDTISYRDFVNMMLGKRSAVLKLVMMFEGKANESSPKPVGPPPERDIASLP
ncbi:PREDICTED: allograft inflammatory factor 1-like [Lipotes vexillifer]|uniref:Allograft inflammatory factor 1 n=1 Tax=Lipotes vexillifer TaxID=118797 RepID=A0A340WZX2_LIPVE|nr:PREDICTED: allograft inflammatory factor 1-like [Lipotes vexillifer]